MKTCLPENPAGLESGWGEGWLEDIPSSERNHNLVMIGLVQLGARSGSNVVPVGFWEITPNVKRLATSLLICQIWIRILQKQELAGLSVNWVHPASPKWNFVNPFPLFHTPKLWLIKHSKTQGIDDGKDSDSAKILGPISVQGNWMQTGR